MLNRKRPACGVKHVDGQPTVVFDTVCTKGKRPWLATEQMHEILVGIWRDQATAWLVGRYIIMPDHVHYFAWATERTIPFDNWVKFWKSKFTWAHGQQDKRMQRNDWDRRMRTESQYEEKWEYIRHNASRAGLVEHADQWPFQGTVFNLDW